MDDGGSIGGVPCCIAVIINDDIGGGGVLMLLMLFEQTTERDCIDSANGSCNDEGGLCNLHDDDNGDGGVYGNVDLLLQLQDDK